MWVAFFFSKNISVFAIFNDQSFKETLTNDIVSFEQLGPEKIIVFSFFLDINMYSKTSMIRTLMSNLPGVIRTRFRVL